MARDSGRESPEAFPALPNILLVIVLVLLLMWGIAGLYPPETPGGSVSGEAVLTSDTVPPKSLGDVAVPAAE